MKIKDLRYSVDSIKTTLGNKVKLLTKEGRMLSREEKAKLVLKEIEENRNHSWYEELYERNKNNLDKNALYFRGDYLTYGEFFTLVQDYAKALKANGVDKGDEFVACLRQTPDYPILVAAASLIGAKVNLVAPDFDKDYLAEIINNASAKLVLCDDWDFSKVKTSLHKSCADKKIVTLPVDRWNKDGNKFADITEKYFKFNEKEFEESLSEFDNVISIDDFIESGKDYEGELNGHGKLSDEIAITYTSGSTRKGVHKGVAQRNETYIIMGRYHDHEVSGVPKMDKIRSLVTVGPHADTTLLTGVSDTLMQGGIVTLDPIIDENYFLHSLKINDAGLVVATRSYWLNAMKNTYFSDEFKGIKLPGLYVPSEGGEPLGPGEEKALNRWLKDVSAGTAVTKTLFSIVKMTVGGGDSEHGSLFLKLFRGYSNFLQKIRGIDEPMGLEYYDFIEVESLREDGTYCGPMEVGRLVANSPISMKHYHNNPEATEKYFITDAYGKVWGDMGCYGYKDKWRNVYMKGRIKDTDEEIKPFQICDEISKDTKNILSCEVVPVLDEEYGLVYVAHIEPQIFGKVNVQKTILSAEQRLSKKFNGALDGRIFYRWRTNKEGFPMLFTAKRNTTALREEGISEKCINPKDLEYQEKGQVKVKTK